jgi:hypothetical protein
MTGALYNVGDVVSLNTHPFFDELTNIIISGDSTSIPPLMVVISITQIKSSYQYKCIWYSTRSNRFRSTNAMEADIKRIEFSTSFLNPVGLRRGMQVVLKTAKLEISKKKSSLFSTGDTKHESLNLSINSSLSFLSPTLVYIDCKKNEHASGSTSIYTAKCILFDSINDKYSELLIPLEALEIVAPINASQLVGISTAINNQRYLEIKTNDGIIICEPLHINSREGCYFLNVFDIIRNVYKEISIDNETFFIEIENPFRNQVPEFNIEKKSEAATKEYISAEIENAIKKGRKRKSYLYFKYINNNDQLTKRSIKSYKLVRVVEKKFPVTYLVGYCMKKNAKRNFRIDRIQELKELAYTYD